MDVSNALDRIVQLAGETKLDACPGDYRPDLADSLPGHPRQLWVRDRAGDQEESALAGNVAVRRSSLVRFCGHFLQDGE